MDGGGSWSVTTLDYGGGRESAEVLRAERIMGDDGY